MKSFVLWLLALLMMLAPTRLPALPASAVNTAAQFDAANRLYEQGKFAEAAAAYEAIRRDGVASAALFFNLGNALFKAARIGQALVAYRHAEQLSPRDPDVQANLRFTRNQVQGPTYNPSRLEQWLRKLSLNEWTVLVAVALWLAFVSLAIAQLHPKSASALRKLAATAAVAAVVLGSCLGLALRNYLGTKSAIVTAHEVSVRNGPFGESPSAFTVHDGAELLVLDHKDNWLQVTDGNRRTGWLKRSEVVLLNGS
jgi:tetratricopeptide (TPR) repeat protein